MTPREVQPVRPAPIAPARPDPGLASDDEIDFSDFGDTQSYAPKVRVAANGNIVVDQDSMRIVEKQTQRTIVRDDGSPGVGYGKAAKPDKWTEEETDQFYQVGSPKFLRVSQVKLIRQIGTDFTIMQFFYPNRNRGQIKAKFKREERVNPRRITKALTNPLPFGLTQSKIFTLTPPDVKKFEEVSGMVLPGNATDEEEEDDEVERRTRAAKDLGEDVSFMGDERYFDDEEKEYDLLPVFPAAREPAVRSVNLRREEPVEDPIDIPEDLGLNEDSDNEFDFGL